MKVLLDSSKPFYKANLHTHTDLSDGRYSVEETKAEYKKRGYSIVAFTDHEHLIDNSYLDEEDFLTITSCEVAIKEFPEQSTLKNFGMKVCHMNFYALDQHNTLTPCYSSIYDHYINDKNRDLIRHDGEYERVHSAQGINEMIRMANEQGFLVAYNHPSWSLETALDYLNYEGLFAIEIYNTGCVQAGHGDDERAFNDMLRVGKRLYCTAADDAHNLAGFGSPYNDAFGGWVCINAEKLEYSTIMEALKNGDFYASTGPQIKSLTRDGNIVKIETSGCKKINLRTGGRRTKKVIANEGEEITSAEFELQESDVYFRIRIEDAFGKRAYTQPYPVNE